MARKRKPFAPRDAFLYRNWDGSPGKCRYRHNQIKLHLVDEKAIVARLNEGMSQAALATELGVTQSALSKFLGRRQRKWKTYVMRRKVALEKDIKRLLDESTELFDIDDKANKAALAEEFMPYELKRSADQLELAIARLEKFLRAMRSSSG